MSKPFTWSYSSLSLFQQCPHKYYRLRVVKDIVEPPTEHLNFGLDVHKVCEDYISKDVPIPEKYSYIQQPLDSLKKMEGEKLCEYKMGLTRDLEPCGFFDKNVWWRGVADLIILQGEKAMVVDYKTGKSSRYADTKQLDILSLAAFKHFPQVQHVKGGLLFLVAGDLIKAQYSQGDASNNWVQWLGETARLESSHHTGVWNKKPNFTCNGWCPVADCEHSQKRR